MELSNFYVVTVISNSKRYQSRYRLYREFKAHIESFGVKLFTVELQLGERPFEITQAGDPFNLQLRSNDELWHKEIMMNLAVERLPSTWKYVGFFDADIFFYNPKWPEETVHALQHYQVVQCFQTAVDLDPNYNPIKSMDGIMHRYFENGCTIPDNLVHYIDMEYAPEEKPKVFDIGHPGFAWAFNREAFNDLGGLIDIGILGSGDRHIAYGLLGVIEKSAPAGMISRGYLSELKEWEARALKHIKKDVGFVKGTIGHHFHGKKRDRRYQDRWKILVKYAYDPDTDIKRDWQGLYQVCDETDRQIGLRDEVRNYFAMRNEDSIDL